MDEDRAGSNNTIGTERQVEAYPGIFGFYYAMTVDVPLPRSPPLSAIQSIIDRVNAAAKPVGTVSRAPDSPS